jgi:hypothetical protein
MKIESREDEAARRMHSAMLRGGCPDEYAKLVEGADSCVLAALGMVGAKAEEEHEEEP